MTFVMEWNFVSFISLVINQIVQLNDNFQNLNIENLLFIKIVPLLLALNNLIDD